MNLVFFILLLAAMLGVVLSLVAGIFVMTKGGEMNKKYSNRLMQTRIWMQALALVFFILCIITAHHS
jgi:hypothetical protein